MVVCPSCGSSRIRSDYKPAPFFLRLVGIRGLLCDNCNFPFRAFSLLAPKTRRPQHSKRKANVFNPAPVPAIVGDLAQVRQPVPVEKTELRLVKPPSGKLDFAVVASATPSPASTQARVVTDQIAPVRNDLRTEITRIHAPGAKEPSQLNGAQLEPPVSAVATSATHVCPECNSRNIRRRRRNFVERTLLSLGEHKAYVCRECDASFYAKREEHESQPAAATVARPPSSESSRFMAEKRG